MRVPNSFDYAVLRLVPRVEREEFINTGVVLFSLQKKFLDARVHLEPERLRVLWPELDYDMVRDHLEAFPKICAGFPDAGPIARLPQRQRFHWLVSPRSTMIQVSPVHSGLSESPADALESLFQKLVLR